MNKNITKWLARIILGIITSPLIILAVATCWLLPVLAWLFETAGFDAKKDGWLFAMTFVLTEAAWIIFLMAWIPSLFGGSL